VHIAPLELPDVNDGHFVQQFCFSDPSANLLAIGTGKFSAGERIGERQCWCQSARETLFVLKGAIEISGEAGKVSIYAGQTASYLLGRRPMMVCVEDAEYLYVVFGRKAEVAE